MEVPEEPSPALRIVQSDDEYRRRARREERSARIMIGVAVLAALALVGILVWLFVGSPPYISD
jgi:hypothetical protein